MNLKRISDADHASRFNDLMNKVGDTPKNYLSQLSRCKGAKKGERAQVFYDLAKKNKLTETAEAIKEAYPEVAKEEMEQEEEKRREAARAERKQRLENELASKKQQVENLIAFGDSGIVFFHTSKALARADKLFTKLVNKNEGLVVEVHQGDTSVGSDYEARNGRAWTIANKYVLTFNGVQKIINVANVTCEGGGTYGFIVNRGPKTTWRDSQQRIEAMLKIEGLTV